MDALLASYGSDSDGNDGAEPSTISNTADSENTSNSGTVVAVSAGNGNYEVTSFALPPPPVDLLGPPPSQSIDGQCIQVNRVRSFPHVEGNYALHVFIPVLVPSPVRRHLVPILKKISSLVPDLHVVDADIPVYDLLNEDQQLEKHVLGKELHISLGRTVPISVHQIDSIVSMLRQKLQTQRWYWIDFSKWEVFVNDDNTRTFLSLEVTEGGLTEITRQIQMVDTVYRLHGLPEFYKNPRPHVSLLWALGDISILLKQAVKGLERSSYNISSGKSIVTCKFSGVECKIGKKSFKICRISDH